MSTAGIPVHIAHDPRQDTVFAWLSLLFFIVSFGASFLVGEGLATWLFGWPDGAEPALWQILAASVPALVVFALPVVPCVALRHARPSQWLAQRSGGRLAQRRDRRRDGAAERGLVPVRLRR
ncbi:hypothetical protein LKO27_10390 [Tessaracoccus sp. OS52]|uniref:hypothetical protein n=1 Tax=Tessaracoccus sp. OS52 TaxID=2886691 RepID=UPI001D10FBCC|nr:hypothetical protein [Tessaracoccus sp. OS52]MCC2593812.1 hypothetical protein [Tessaracoccus sp. OS52]